MSDKNTRGRASKVDLLPPDIKTRLAMMLRDKMFSQAEILEEINDLIRDCGLPDDMRLSKTGLNRYASRMEKMGARIRQSREIAEVWTKQFGEMPQSDIGKTLMELVKQIAFDTSMYLGDQQNGVSAKDLSLLSAAVQRLEQAESLSFKREQAIRQETIKRAAEAVEQAGKQANLSINDVSQMIKAVYGLDS
ncbi:DUF3486 family protein [Lonepinella koalarum]|uniref:DUF3486 family protein n=1 Tax=Lonepinella koalarum TaxID=53417 RepID=UPI0011E4773E|nr:DUF3486 family protein [Lonepinella koalarum]TYG34176.1 DUF3486 family protein [Lonepinella koalarum]